MTEPANTIGTIKVNVDTSGLDVATEKAERLKATLDETGKAFADFVKVWVDRATGAPAVTVEPELVETRVFDKSETAQGFAEPEVFDQWAYGEICEAVRALAARLNAPVAITVETGGLAIRINTASGSP